MSITNNNTYIIYNKKYDHAKIALPLKEDVCTYEPQVCADQFWMLEESESHSGYYYIKNADRMPFRLAQLNDHGDLTCYDGQYNDDQLWRFEQDGDYYRIYNYKYSSYKIAKPGKKGSDFCGYDGPNYEDQLWKLVPRYEVRRRELEIWSIDNRLVFS